MAILSSTDSMEVPSHQNQHLAWRYQISFA